MLCKSIVSHGVFMDMEIHAVFSLQSLTLAFIYTAGLKINMLTFNAVNINIILMPEYLHKGCSITERLAIDFWLL